ncbi:MAG: hypothetical protein JXA99_02075 [Candidatus Lokiarchaeota archaeon]|nr:hypothetical protein [Candidatus Lokiarchaeota archaeon]
MKYLKLFEDLDPKMDELKLLYSHLINIIKEFGYDYIGYYGRGKYSSEFSKNNKNLIVLEISVNFGQQNIKINRMSSDNITEVFPEYLKTVKGLKNTKNRSLNGRIEEYNFRVIGKIQNIIKRINKEDIEKLSDLLNSKKEYNL